jgi:hypothetical protein
MRKSDAGLQLCGRCWDGSSVQGQGEYTRSHASVRNTRSNLIKPLVSGIPSTRPTLPKGRGRRSILKKEVKFFCFSEK